MPDILASLGCLLFVWGLPVVSVCLVFKMLAEVRQERAKRRAEAAQRESPGESVWPPQPEEPKK